MKDLQKEIAVLIFQIKKLCKDESLDSNSLEHLITLSLQLKDKYLILDYIKDERNKGYR